MIPVVPISHPWELFGFGPTITKAPKVTPKFVPKARMIPRPIIEGIQHKECQGPCGRLLPMTAFNKNSSNYDGTENKCKKCAREYGRYWYSKRSVKHDSNSSN